MRHSRPDYNRIQDPAGIIPESMRVFLILEKDLAAAPALRAYATFAERLGASARFVDSVRRWADEIATWQAQNPMLVKVPDSPEPDCPECKTGYLLPPVDGKRVCEQCGFTTV